LEKAPEAFRTISEVADELDVPKHVLRFWEAKFSQLKPMKRGGGRRYYRPEDVDLLRGIRLLLYSDGYTIRGVQKILREQGPRYVMDYQGGGDGPDHEVAGPDISDGGADDEATDDGAADVVRSTVSRNLGPIDEDLSALIDELEACRQILANANSQD